MSITTANPLESLRSAVAGAVHLPGDEGWDAARQAWNLALDQRPAAVAHPFDEDDVAAVIRHAAAHGLRVAPQGTGHNAAPLGDLSGSILLRTSSMRGVEIDAVARRARVRAGALWQEVVDAAQPHGLSALAGSSPDVGVVGYSLGGGIGWLARRHGMQCSSVTAIELVTADGELVRATATSEPDLFWALRGGGHGFGVVTAMEFDLYPYATLVGGAMAWDWQQAGPVLQRWAEWSATAPEEISTSARIMQMPPLPEVPEPLRGRQLVMIDGAFCGAPEDADRVLAPLRELGPEIDLFGPIPGAALTQIHGDPPMPVPCAPSGHAMLGALPPAAVDAFVAAAGPGSGSHLLAAELRQLGGALARTPAGAGALGSLAGDHALFAVGMAMDAGMAAAVEASANRLVAAMAPWSEGRAYLNFSEHPTDPSRAFERDTLARLRAIREQADPTGLLQPNHAL